MVIFLLLGKVSGFFSKFKNEGKNIKEGGNIFKKDYEVFFFSLIWLYMKKMIMKVDYFLGINVGEVRFF